MSAREKEIVRMEMVVQCAFNFQIIFRGFFRVRCAVTISAGGTGAPLVLAD